MCCWFSIVLTLFVPSLAQVHANIGHERRQSSKRIILTSRGDAYGNSLLEDRGATKGGPWELRKSLADPTGIPQPWEDVLEQPTAAPDEALLATEARKYVQQVNGSTPAGWMQIGTPAKDLKVIFDTGSDKLVAKTWDTLSAELDSIDQGVEGMVMPSSLIYNHNTSSTYAAKYMTNPRTGQVVPAKNEIAYGSGVAITDEGNDTVKLGPFKLHNFSLSEITADSLQLLHDKHGISGILGLQHMKNRSLGRSIFSRMREAGILTSFGYCRGTGNNGTFIWGDDSNEGHELNVIGDMHWAVTLGNLKVNGQGSGPSHHDSGGDGDVVTHQDGGDDSASLAVRRSTQRTWTWPFSGVGVSSDDSPDSADAGEEDQEFSEQLPCHDSKCTAILDTGSNIIAGPTAVMKAISEKANVAPDCSNYDSLPTISFKFGGKDVTVHPEGYVMKVPMPNLGADNGDGDGDGDGGGDPAGGGGGGGDGDGDGQLRQNAKEELEMPGLNGMGLEQQGARRQRAKSGWKAVFEHLKTKQGIDLRPTIGDFQRFENTSQPEFMCMAALVPLDKHTKFGPLFVVGTPLLQTNYARWSFAKGAKSPKIHIKKLSDANVCRHADPSHASASLEAAAAPTYLMRSEKTRPETPASTPRIARRGPFVRRIDEISFPHWAKTLADL